mmetsp:Transcript_15537/g.25914  ORF Transcript_15537/g.25914 Transcript_15537/m.25914 type:complete len:200 (-) Transcript_15537:32-631(-)
MAFHQCLVVNHRLMFALTLMPTVSSMFPPSRSRPERNKRLPSPTTRVVFPKTRSSAWWKKLRSTRLKMMPTRTVSRPRTALRTTATASRPRLVPRKSRTRSLPTRRPSSKPPLMRPSAGSMPTPPERRKNSRRSKRPSRLLPTQFFRPWAVVPEVCQVACLIWEVCLTWAVPEVLLQLKILLADQPSRRSIKGNLELLR